jgi:hypothetical protein
MQAGLAGQRAGSFACLDCGAHSGDDLIDAVAHVVAGATSFCTLQLAPFINLCNLWCAHRPDNPAIKVEKTSCRILQ